MQILICILDETYKRKNICHYTDCISQRLQNKTQVQICLKTPTNLMRCHQKCQLVCPSYYYGNQKSSTISFQEKEGQRNSVIYDRGLQTFSVNSQKKYLHFAVNSFSITARSTKAVVNIYKGMSVALLQLTLYLQNQAACQKDLADRSVC